MNSGTMGCDDAANFLPMATDHADFFDRLASPRFSERLFARLPDVVFCLKDDARRYRAANAAFAARVGLADPARLLGLRAEDFFAPELAANYREQDEQVLASGEEISDRLELVSDRKGALGWFLATKVPLRDAAGVVIGLASISRDLGAPREEDVQFSGLRRVVDHVRSHLDEPLRADALADLAELSVTQLDRRMRRVFQLSTAQFVRKARIDHAVQLLATTQRPVAEIALDCGYGDQTAFTRQFRSTVGQPPASYRDQRRRG